MDEAERKHWMLGLVRDAAGPAVDLDVVPGAARAHGVRLRLSVVGGPTALLVLEGGLWDLRLEALGVGAVEIIGDGDDLEEQSDAIRALTGLAVHYLSGGGRLERRRSRVLRREVPVWAATVDGETWELSRRWSRRGPA